MKKSLIAIAALAAVGAASAQSSVTLYGTVDTAVEQQKTTLGTGASTKVKTMSNNRQGTSGLYVKGVEDLGGGLQAIFLYEGDFDATTNNGTTTHAVGIGGGEIYGGLNGAFGTVKLGSPNQPTLSSQAARQPFGTKLGGGFGENMMGQAHVRNAKSIAYSSPNFSGLQAHVYLTPGTGTAGTASTQGVGAGNSEYDLGLNYAAGPVNAWLTYVARKQSYKLTTLVGSYTFGPATATLGFHKETFQNALGTDNKGFNVAGTYAITPELSLLANVMKKDNANTNVDETEFAFGPKYLLSKRTSVYALYVQYKKSNLAATSTSTAKQETFLLGLMHNF